MKELVQELKAQGVLKTEGLINAFLAVDRKNFVPPDFKENAYEDYPLPIGAAQTISQPYTVAFMLELLGVRKGEKVLDVGAGSGWTTALLAYIVGPQGKVYGTELVPELVELGKENLATCKFPQAKILQAEKGVLGLSQQAPFDRILVSATAREVPQKLLDQLKEYGIMVLVVENAILRIQKILGEKPNVQRFEGFVFVPLR